MQELRLSTGVRLGLRPVSPFALKKIQGDLRKTQPRVPIIHIDDQDRDVEVPEDPAYQEALGEWQAEVVEATYNAMIILGTSVIEVPDGVQKVDDLEWASDLRAAGLTVPDTGKERYLAWVKLYAAANTADLNLIMADVNRVGGVTEDDAAKAAATFRRST